MANARDSQALISLVTGALPIRSCRGPARLHGGQGARTASICGEGPRPRGIPC